VLTGDRILIRNALELRKLQRNLKLSASELRALQESKLRLLVEHAYRNVPYYHSLFDDAGLRPGDIQSLDDLPLIPVSTREALQSEASDRRVDQTLNFAQLHKLETSGSSGKPLKVFVTPAEARTQRMVQFRALLEVGFQWRDRMVQLDFPVMLKPGLHERLGIFRADRIHRAAPPGVQYQRICQMNPSVLWAYPSGLEALCDHAGRPMYEWMQPRMVITSAEILPPALARRIDDELGAERFNFYGCIEVGRIAWECSTHQGLHINSDQLILECVRDGQPVSPGESGSIVVTALNAFGSPMIRYDLGDIGRLLKQACSCGSPFPLMGPPEGRIYELMVLPSGRTLTPFVINYWVSEASPGSYFRIIQHRRDHLEVLFVNKVEEEQLVAARLREKLERELSEPVQIDIRRVDNIPNDGPKYRSFIGIQKPSSYP
jgi:phenylacetate-CoA ligase